MLPRKYDAINTNKINTIRNHEIHNVSDLFYVMLNRNIHSENTIIIEMVRNDTDSMICFYGVNKRCIDGLECLNT